jgi:hypothetical protein
MARGSIFIVPPGSRLGPLDDATRAELVARSPLAGFYEKTIDRESAYERLRARAAESAPQRGDTEFGPAPTRSGQPSDERSLAEDILFGRRGPRGGRQSQGLIEVMTKSAARTMGSQAGRAFMRGVLGSLLGGRR